MSLLGVLGCGDDTRTGDIDAPDTQSPIEVAPEVAPMRCEVALTEVDGGFVEIVTKNDCADWSLAIRDGGSTSCGLAAEVFFPRGGERVALEGFRVPAQAVIVVQDPKLAAIAVWTLGTCEPDPSCLGFIQLDTAEQRGCLPADTATGTVSLCGEQWVADKVATPGQANDCNCGVDCAAAAGVCETGSCVDGACAFVPKDEGNACDDGNACTSGDTCRAGDCAGDVVQCAPPAGSCQRPGTCSPATGECVYVDDCVDDAACTANGCQCDPGYAGDGTTACKDIDECALGDTGCHALARCVNQVGGYLCACPLGYTGDGRTCTPTTCACPWEDPATCGPAFRRLRVRVVDIWAQPIRGASLALVDQTEQVIVAEDGDAWGWEIDQPLCASRDFGLNVGAPNHHAFSGTIHWLENDIELEAAASPDYAWSITWDDAGPVVWVGLAHRWFAASGRPAHHGNRVTLYGDGESAWGAVYTEMQLAQRLVTGTSWRWESDHEIIRGDNLYLDPDERWRNTILGALEALEGIEKKIMVGQFISQDGLFADISVDDALIEKAETPGDDFEYMGHANPSNGQFTVYPQPVALADGIRARHPDVGDLIDDGPASPFRGPIDVDMSDLPLGLSLLDLPIASWHQKFWTFDQTVAFVGGMNVQKLDWDTAEHRVFEPKRMEFDADSDEREAVRDREEEPEFAPRKDYMVRLEGPIVNDVVEVFDIRWQHQLDEEVDYSDFATPLVRTPTTATYADGVQAQLIATMPDPFDENAILETLVRAVRQAKHLIYIEDQYFRAPILYDAIVQRMTEEPNLQLVVITASVGEWTDPACYQTAIANQRFASLFPNRYRVYQLRAFDYVRTDCTFCWDETEAHFVDFDIHSKLVMIDDVYLETGSCNSNNRGLLYEGELAIAVHDPVWVAAERKRIFERILGPRYNGAMPLGDVFQAFDEAARENQRAYANWDAEGMDVDLDGDALPADWIPSGFLYPLFIDVPDECLIEGVGSDVT